MRDADTLLADGLAVINTAFKENSIWGMLPLLSGGHDSHSACKVASEHSKFKGQVFHIDTWIGSRATRQHVEAICKDEEWTLRVYKTRERDNYENFVRKFGFPGPSMHRICYIRLKERCVDMMTKIRGRALGKWLLVSGARSQESTRRMGYVEPIKVIGNRVWVAPCHDWSSDEQKEFMDAFGCIRNPVKLSPLGMSGECFCGAFARPNELGMIRRICPDVAVEIDRLSQIAKANGLPHEWGKHPLGVVEVEETGPLCHGCDVRLKSAGIVAKHKE